MAAGGTNEKSAQDWRGELKQEIIHHLYATLIAVLGIFLLLTPMALGDPEFIEFNGINPLVFIVPLIAIVIIGASHAIPVYLRSREPILHTILLMFLLFQIAGAIADFMETREWNWGSWIFGGLILVLPLVALSYIVRFLVPKWRPRLVFQPAEPSTDIS